MSMVQKALAVACPSCGKENPAGNKFCSWCGAPLVVSGSAEKSIADAPQTTCGSCGAALVPGHKFCTACGTAVGAQPLANAAAVGAAASQPGELQKNTTGPQPLAAAGFILENPHQEQRIADAEETQPRAAHGAPGSSTVPHESLSPEAVPPQLLPQELEGPFTTTPKTSRAWLLALPLVVVIGVAGWYLWRYFSGPDVTVTAFPKKIHVATGGRTFLQASVAGSKDADIEWSIQEGNKGGKVVSQGTATDQGRTRAEATYTAPQTSGTFHVIAASHANSKRTATVEIVVGSLAPTPAPAPSTATNPATSQIAGTWRWPSGDTQMTIGTDGTIVVTSGEPQKNLSGTYRFTDSSHVEVNFGNGDVRTWQILGLDSRYLRVLSQSKTESSPTALVFARIGG